MAKVLWIGDAGVQTGFGRVSEEIGGRLVNNHDHEVHALAVGWQARDAYEGPLKLYRADAGDARSQTGLDRVVEMIEKIGPDVVFLNEDAPLMLRRLNDNRFDRGKALLQQRVLGYMPVDGEDVPQTWLDLTQQVNIIPMSRFGAEELGLSRWVHHGVDPVVFHPATETNPIVTSDGQIVNSKAAAKAAFQIPEDAFVIGRVDTNTARKDFGATWKAIDTAYQRGLPAEETVAVFHTKQRSYANHGTDLPALITKGDGRYMITNGSGWPVEDVVALMNAFDVFLSTSRGEGFGLTILEAMACGVPVIATNCSAISEVVWNGGVRIQPLAKVLNLYGLEQAIANTSAMADALLELHGDTSFRERLSRAALEQAQTFSWDQAASQIHGYIESLLKLDGGALLEA